MINDVLSGQRALVTGAANGIGRACALALAGLGAEVLVLDLGCDPTGGGSSEGAGDAVVDEIRGGGGRAVGIFADVADGESVRTAFDSIRERSTALQIAVLAAGIMRNRMIFNMTEDEWSSVMNVHLLGTMHVLREVLPGMVESGYGRIVTFTSISGLYGVTGASNYATAKAGIESLTRAVAEQHRGSGVAVNAMSPGASTRLGATTVEGSKAQEIAMTSLQARTGLPNPNVHPEPRHVARVVAALCLPECRITGECVHSTGNVIAVVPAWRPKHAVVRVGAAAFDLGSLASVLT
jgi:NAD(P)-dependent dehydrogenase (short-subunit alcohol dehydrogenase family)